MTPTRLQSILSLIGDLQEAHVKVASLLAEQKAEHNLFPADQRDLSIEQSPPLVTQSDFDIIGLEAAEANILGAIEDLQQVVDDHEKGITS